jgi:UDP:flavonoid glycosyltransferase YjiC (YdhE family)
MAERPVAEGSLSVGRFLFVVPPLHGHTNPTLAVGRALAARRHHVAWTGYPDPLRSLLPPDAEMISVFDSMPSEIVNAVSEKSLGLRGASALKFLWEDFQLPLARAMIDGVEKAVDLFKPDVLIVDQQALAGAIVAQRRKLAWATSATTSAELTQPFTALPRVGEWVDGLLRELQRELGAPEGSGDPRFSEHLVVVFTTPELVGQDRSFPEHYAFVGPSLTARPETIPFDWDWLDARPRVLISLGTLNAEVGGHFFAAALEAFADGRRQAILVASPEDVGPTPAHVLVQARVPQLELLKHVDAVVCHGGHNTVCETLAHGLPLVVAPIRDDQPVIAEQVARSGAGLRVRFGRLRADALAGAVSRVLEEPSFRSAAQRIQGSFRSAGGAERAAERLEAML